VPIAKRARIDGRSALVVGATAVFVALVIGLLVFYLAGRDDIQVRLGDDRFQDINAESVAEKIAQDGPIIYQDLAGGSRDIYVQHLGDDPEQGWLAFDVRPAGEARECALSWQAGEQQFVDNGSCSESFTFPPDGRGLPQYPATVNDDGKVVIDLNAAERPTTTVEPTTTATPTTTGS
jgi:hypothetical protein